MTDRAHLRALPGEGHAAGVNPERLLDYWHRAEERALFEAQAAPLGGLIDALDHAAACRERRQLAERRVARAECERAGRAWLWLVGGSRG